MNDNGFIKFLEFGIDYQSNETTAVDFLNVIILSFKNQKSNQLKFRLCNIRLSYLQRI